MADWNGFKKNGETYIPNDATARASISTIEGKIPNGTTSSNPLVNQSTMENTLDGKADVGDVTSLAESVSAIEDKIPSNASSSNQLATRSEVSAAYKPKGNATLATLPPLTTANLNNVYNMTEDFTTTADFAEGAGKEVKAGNEVGIINIATDPDALNIKYTVLGGFIDLSEYATQASVTSALADKVDKVTGKGLSTNDYDDTEKAKVAGAFPRSEQAVLGVKNLALANRATTQTISSMDFTVNDSDKNVVTANGTNSAEVWFNYMDIELPEGDYIGSGCTNGSDTTYMLSFIIRNAGNTADETTIKCFNGDVNITVPTGGRHVRAFIVVRNGKTLTNQLFKLMIRLATDTDDTYVPYAMTNRELTEEIGKQFFDISSNGTTFNIPWKRESSGRYSFGLIMYAGGLYHVMVKGPTDSNAVYLTKIVDTDANRTLTGSFADDVLTITASSTLYGGITAILNNIVKS